MYVMHVTPKVRRGAETLRPQSCDAIKYTSGMSFALAIALSFEAIGQISSSSVLAKKLIKMRRLAMQNEAVLRFMHLRDIQYILGALHAHL